MRIKYVTVSSLEELPRLAFYKKLVFYIEAQNAFKIWNFLSRLDETSMLI